MADGAPVDLATLIHHVARVPGIERIRFTTSHPLEFDDSLIEAFAHVDKLANHLHLPVQSGSDRVLALMKRGYTALEFKDKVRRLRAVRPDISISSDFIVGFPGRDRARFRGDARPRARAWASTSPSASSTAAVPARPPPRCPMRWPPALKQAAPRAPAGAARGPGAAHQRGHGRQRAARADRAARRRRTRASWPAAPPTIAG